MATASLGYYDVSVGGEALERSRAAAASYVEEYKKPEYQVTVEARCTARPPGQLPAGTIEARYFSRAGSQRQVK